MALTNEYMERVHQFATWAAGADGIAMPEWKEAFERVRFFDPEIDMQFDAFMFGLSIGKSETAAAVEPVPVQSKITPLVWWGNLPFNSRESLILLVGKDTQYAFKSWFNLSFEVQEDIEKNCKRLGWMGSPWE